MTCPLCVREREHWSIRPLTTYDASTPPNKHLDQGPGGAEMEAATLTPLRPDRLGEDLVGLHLADHPHTGPLLAALLTNSDPVGDTGTVASNGVDELAIRRCLIVLTAAAARHTVAATTMFALLERHPALVAHATAPTVQLVTDHAPDTLAATVDTALPRFSTELLRPAAALAQRLCDTLPTDTNLAERAHRLSWLGIRLSEVGDKRGALGPTEEAVAIRRRLVEAESAAYLPDLAKSLWGFGWVRAASGDETRRRPSGNRGSNSDLPFASRRSPTGIRGTPQSGDAHPGRHPRWPRPPHEADALRHQFDPETE
ncbi:MAG: hypothetical protein M3Z25_14930 [Actinomycetota bacterium]|nr:hypothetical protein [Actinomycetota bacterium]